MKKAFRILLLVVLFCSVSLYASAQSLREGDSGEDVREVQSRLYSLGYLSGDVDGDFGSATAEAVRKFQSDRGLEADGIVGAQTYYALMGREMQVSRDASSARVRRVVQTALRYTGVPYVFGGTTPNGFDCSGYTQFVFARSGIYLPRTADDQYMMGYSVSRSSLQPGDLVFFTTYTEGASHVGIYLGNGEFISATSSQGVRVDSLYSNYWGARYIGAKRVL